SQLRKALTRNGHDPIATVDGGYRIGVGADELDAAHLRQLLANARECALAGELEAAAELLRQTLALWRGPALAGLLLESPGREGMKRLLETSPDLEVAAVCEDLDSLLAAVEAERPDVVVTDIRMPPGNLDEGIRASDRLRVEHPDVGVVVLSQYLEPAYALALFEAGTERRAYLLKERVHDVGQLVAAIRAVAEGGSVVDPKVVEALVAEKTRREHSPLNELTPRERDVLREMAEGKNNAAIAEALHLSERTVEKVIHSIFLKLDLAWEPAVHKRVKAVIFYLSGTAAETRPAERSS